MQPSPVLAWACTQTDSDPTPVGWIASGTAATELAQGSEGLNVLVHRARRAIRDIGIVDASNIIERQPGELRIGVDASQLGVTRLTLNP